MLRNVPNVQREGMAVNELPIIQCGKGESVWDTARKVGYTNLAHRVGNTPTSQPLLWEKIVAWVKASHYSVAYPIFGQKQEKRKEHNDHHQFLEP